MLTRFRVNGFKNLVDVDLHFGPFTCIAGLNAVGKSNLFDALMFFGSLAELSFVEAATKVRDDQGRSSDIRSLFYSSGGNRSEKMVFEAEMLIPPEGTDDLGQSAKASVTFLSYSVTLRYRSAGIDGLRSSLQLEREQLTYINRGDAPKHLPFPYSRRWLKSVLRGRRTSPFISTEEESDHTIKLHQEGTSGRAKSFRAESLPRTVLSTVNAAESPTAVLARKELQSWRLLQLEPTALRSPDSFTAPTSMSSDGQHLPATLYHLAHSVSPDTQGSADEQSVYARIGNRLARLVDDVQGVAVERDDTREVLTLKVEGRDGTTHAARALSDGTLRFLALAVLAEDPNAKGLLCLEEPENGIHPERIAAMLELLSQLAVNTNDTVDDDNALRQVIINTHSPAVVAQTKSDSVLFAERVEHTKHGQHASSVSFRYLSNTWRSKLGGESGAVQRGRVMGFLTPVRTDSKEPGPRVVDYSSWRVAERPDFAQLRLELGDQDAR